MIVPIVDAPRAPEPLRASLGEQIRALRLGAEPSDALLDAVLERAELPGGDVVVVRPASWPALLDAERASGRSAPYWAIMWPSGLSLACAVADEPPVGRRVLELGCGLGLPSVAAARGGARVVATDGAPDAVAYAAHNLALNGLRGDVAVADWHDAPALARGGPFDLVLAADVLYLRRNVEQLLRLLPGLVAPDGEVWLADPGRNGAREFLAVARRQWRISSAPDPVRDQVTLHRLARAA